MTKQSVIIGLLLAAAIAGFTHINNNVIQQAGLIENFMPISVYGFLVLAVLVINPLLRSINPKLGLKGKEYAVILAISLVACVVPGSGLMRFFPNAMMKPHKWVKTRFGWDKRAPLQKVPQYMLAGRAPDFAADDFSEPATLCQSFVANAQSETPSPAQERLWSVLTDDARTKLQSVSGDTDETVAVQILRNAFNPLLNMTDLYQVEAFPKFAPSAESKRILLHAGSKDPKADLAAGELPTLFGAPQVHEGHIRTFNRHLIDSVWPDQIVSRATRLNADVSTYLLGQGDPNKPVALQDIPWAAWKRPLMFWIPLFLIVSVGVIGLSLVIHTQWSQHEQLPYPLARFTNALLPDNEGNPSPLYKEPGFWWAGGAVFVIFMLNYWNLQKPEIIPKFPLQLDFGALRNAFKSLDNGQAQWALFTVRIVPISIGLAYLIRSDVSFSVGISVPLGTIVMMSLAGMGININSSPVSGGRLYNCSPNQLLQAGAALAFAMQAFYYGRSYYMHVLKQALFLKSDEKLPGMAVAGARVFMVSAVAISTYLVFVGVDWFLAIAYTLIAFTMYLVLSRIVAETGVFFILVSWYPCTTILGLLGINAIGPGTAVLMFMFSTVLLVRPKECLMPFAVGALKVLDDQGASPSKTAPWLVGAVILAVIIAVPVSLSYLHGTGANSDGWANAVSQYSFAKANHMTTALKARDRYEEVEATKGVARLGRIELDTKTVVCFLVGGLLVIALSMMRLRYRWWPLHPVIMLIWREQSTVGIWHSFLIGWVIRMLVVKYGGQKAYTKIMPIMMGMIAGNILGLLIPNIIGAIYYFTSGGQRLVSPQMF